MSTSTIRPALHQPTGPAHTRIYAYGAARGEKIVPNDDLVGPIDSSDEWIRQRTGIVTRTRANAETTAIELSTDAAAEAIARSGVDPADIDAVIVATISNPKQTPSVSAIVAGREKLSASMRNGSRSSTPSADSPGAAAEDAEFVMLPLSHWLAETGRAMIAARRARVSAVRRMINSTHVAASSRRVLEKRISPHRRNRP